jgi:hypothetical protein
VPQQVNNHQLQRKTLRRVLQLDQRSLQRRNKRNKKKNVLPRRKENASLRRSGTSSMRRPNSSALLKISSNSHALSLTTFSLKRRLSNCNSNLLQLHLIQRKLKKYKAILMI